MSLCFTPRCPDNKLFDAKAVGEVPVFFSVVDTDAGAIC